MNHSTHLRFSSSEGGTMRRLGLVGGEKPLVRGSNEDRSADLYGIMSVRNFETDSCMG